MTPCSHAAELYRAGQSYPVIAETLNLEGWRPAKRRDTFNGSMVHHLLSKTGIVTPKRRRWPRDILPIATPDEWTIAELARHIPMPEPTLYTWVQQGRLRSRTVAISGRKFTLVYADDAAIGRSEDGARDAFHGDVGHCHGANPTESSIP